MKVVIGEYLYDTVRGELWIIGEDGNLTKVEDEELKKSIEEKAMSIIKSNGFEKYEKADVYLSELMEIMEDYDYYIALSKQFAEIYEKKVIPYKIAVIDLFESIISLMMIKAKDGVRSRERKITPSLTIRVDSGRIYPIIEGISVGNRETYDIKALEAIIDELTRYRNRIVKYLSEISDDVESVETLKNALEIYSRMR